MAFVRQHGNQIAIVSGDRDKETGNVQQRVLFTFYSRDEALAALGYGPNDRKHLFRNLMQQAYPSLSFDWLKINSVIELKLDCLPQRYEGRTTQNSTDFSQSISSLAKKLVLADPFLVPSAKNILKSQESSLIALQELIGHALSLIRFYDSHPAQNEHADFKDEFQWRYMLRGSEVPPDVEEWAQQYYVSMQYQKATAIFELLVGTFENYAEGHNYLGLIALEQRQYKEAIVHFERTMNVGRNLFPRRLPKKDYWLDHATRPFMRGLMNLIITLTCDGNYERALSSCDQLEKECGDKETANAYRGTLYLNLGDWDKAIAHTHDDHFVKAFALFESGKHQSALECFLHEAFEAPHTARLLLKMKKPNPDNYSTGKDHNYGVHLLAQLHGYFQIQSPQAKKFFAALGKQQLFIEMLKKLDGHIHNHSKGPREKHRENFDAWHAMKQKPYIQKQSRELMKAMQKTTVKLLK